MASIRSGPRISRRGPCTHFGGCGLPMQALFGEMYVKTKELGPMGEGGGMRRKILYVDPPMSIHFLKLKTILLKKSPRI